MSNKLYMEFENEIYSSISYKTKSKREELKHNPTSKASFLKFLENFHNLHWLLIIKNYCFYHLWSGTFENLKNEN